MGEHTLGLVDPLCMR